MELGMVGLGKMGSGMAKRLLAGGHSVVGTNLEPGPIEELSAAGGRGAKSLPKLVEALTPPRAVWMMIPSGDPVEKTVDALLDLLDEGDIIADGGNSNYHETMRRAKTVEDLGMHYVDIGTSGGVWGLEAGYSMMIGGPETAVERLRPIFETLAPAPDRGWGRVGPSGAGHFVKMVHNGVEYGMMQAFAEGFSIFRHKEEFGLDLAQVAEIWRHGSVVRSWLLDLIARTLAENPTMDGIAPFVPDSGEGRWTVKEAIDLDVPAPVATLALIARLRSRDAESFADRLLSAMRGQFGGHTVKKEE